MAGLLDFVLPAIFSAGNTAKRQISGLLGDPVGTVKQFINNKNDEAKAHLADVKLSTQGRMAGLLGEQVTPEQLAADQRVNQALANAYNPAGMIVWHGSPHNFTKFDASKIGTGEGAQAYGHGLYLAESPDVAKSYQRALSDSEFVLKSSGKSLRDAKSSGGFAPMMNEMMRNGKTTDDVISTLDGIGRRYKDKYGRDAAKLAEKLRSGAIDYKTGSLYKVDLPDEHIAKMLDWDKPLSQQTEAVKAAAMDLGLPKTATGKDLYNALANQSRDVAISRGDNAATTLGASQAGASSDLLGFGIPGLRYLDGGSRAAGQGTANYVIFPGNEGLLTILERNGVPLR